jgi:4'-phosphopantetheinyl transferase
VWWLAIADVPAAAWPAMLAILDEEERARAARFLREADRRAFIAAHALLRAMLSRVAGTAPREWRFITGSHGKPHIHPELGHPGLEFNLSHTSGAVACGIASGCPIGIDIEDEDRADSHLDIADAYFAPSERARLHAAPAAERPALFLRLWTLKEAYIKAQGRGLSMALDAFAFSLAPIAISFREPTSDSSAHWHFKSLRCAGGHRLSVAVRAAAGSPSLTISRVAYGAIERLARLSPSVPAG